MVSSRRLSSVRTRSISKAATLRPTLTATRDQLDLALGSPRAARGLPRRQSWDGLAVCRRARYAGEKPSGGVELTAPNRDRARSFDRDGRRRGLLKRTVHAAVSCSPARGAGASRLRSIQTLATALASRRLRYASRFRRSHRLVVPDVVSAWRRPDACSSPVGLAGVRRLPQSA